MKRKLPIGIQSFEKIRKEGYYYVDKTRFVAKLADEGTYYFLSRPRRFGKSLFVDTLKQAFMGRKELFEGLYLENNWDWSKNYPVVHIDFAGGVVRNSEDLSRWIIEQLEQNQIQLGLEFRKKDGYRNLFNKLIMEAHKKYGQRVVVLIDEYDKPIFDKIENKEIARENREILKDFYSVLKPLDAYLKFVFLTGVSKFSKVSLFSGLNQLNDITLDRAYSTICGYTQKELESVFAEELAGEDLNEFRCWYNGYNFMGESVYNPFDVLLYLEKKEYRPYWFETGTPEFLVKLLLEKRFYLPNLENLIVSERLIGSFDIDFIEPENLLFQTGYLTIRDFERIPAGLIYYLGYPNKELKISLNNYLLEAYTRRKVEGQGYLIEMTKALRNSKVSEIEKILRSLFSGIPYEWYRKNELEKYEGYYASVIYSFFSGAGFDMVAEDYTSFGRIDLTLFYENRAYIVEFKVLEGEEAEPKAIEILRKKGYHKKYASKCGEIYLVGIDFSEKTRNIVNFEWEKVDL